VTRTFLFVPLFILLFTTLLPAQKNVQVYYDARGNESNQYEADYFTLTNKENDTSWMLAYYRNKGPLKKSEHFKDKKCTIKNGMAAYYNIRGYVDSTGYFVNGVQQGKWFYYADAGWPMQEKEYQDGVVTGFKDIDIRPTAPGDPAPPSSPDNHEVESKFPGGDHAWQQYLAKNMKIPDEVITDAPGNLNETVIVGFTIGLAGDATDILIVKSRLFGLDKLAIDLVKNSGKWTPATKDGIPVLSYKRQPIVFKIMSM
jgi:protein TonB